jgi:hypothetical protein
MLISRFVENHKDKVKTDTLQRLHTAVNLAELLEAKHEGIDPTLRDDQVFTVKLNCHLKLSSCHQDNSKVCRFDY